MNDEDLEIVSIRGYDSGSSPNFAFELCGSRENVNAAYGLINQDGEITTDLCHYKDKSELGCNFRSGITVEDCQKYLTRLPKRLEDEIIRRNLAVHVWVSPELLKQYGLGSETQSARREIKSPT